MKPQEAEKRGESMGKRGKKGAGRRALEAGDGILGRRLRPAGERKGAVPPWPA